MDPEKEKLREVVKEYAEKGYQVILEPTGKDLPPFLRDYTPDVIAKKGKEHVVIEVKYRKDLVSKNQLIEISKRLEGRKNWRFELVVVRPEEEEAEEVFGQAIAWPVIKKRAREASELQDQGHEEAAVLVAWVAIEGAMRQLAKNERLPASSKSTSELIKSLAIHGLITKKDYKSIETWFQTRNSIAHGYVPKKIDSTIPWKVLELVPKFEKEQRSPK